MRICLAPHKCSDGALAWEARSVLPARTVGTRPFEISALSFSPRDAIKWMLLARKLHGDEPAAIADLCSHATFSCN
jgi:hypothetical protein